MLSGQQPFPGPNVTSILYKLVHVDPVEPADLEMNGLVPQKWREVFNKVLAKKPERRYQTASAFVQDLEYCLGSWFSGLGDEETISLAPTGDVVTVEIPRPAPLPVPVAPRGAAAPVSRATRSETLLLPKAAPPPAPGVPSAPRRSFSRRQRRPLVASAEVDGRGRGARPAEASQTQPPEPTLRAPCRRRRAPGARPRRDRAPGHPAAARPRRGSAWRSSPSSRSQRGAAAAPSAAPGPAPASAPAAATPQAASRHRPRPGRPLGTLRVASEPAGARVLVDGRASRALRRSSSRSWRSAATRCASSSPATSRRRGAWSSQRRRRPRPSCGSRSQRRAAPRTGAADFVSTPAGAAVSVDGTPAGQTPLRGAQAPAGPRRVEIALDGHETWTSTLDVTAGREGPRRGAPAAARPRAPPTPEPVDVARVYANEPSEVDTLARKLSGTSPSYPSGRAPRLKSGQRVSVLVRFVVSDTGEVRT